MENPACTFSTRFLPGSDAWRVRGPVELSRRRALRTRSACRVLESFLERPEAHAVRQRDVFARKKPCQDRASSSRSRERPGDFCLPAPRSSARPFDRAGRDRRRGFAGPGANSAYRVGGSHPSPVPRKITPASSLKAAVLHQVLLSFPSYVIFIVIW